DLRQHALAHPERSQTMTTRRQATRPAATRPAATPDAAASLEALASVPHQQLVAATEGACAVFRGFETMRKVQEQAAHHALTRHQQALDKLRQAQDPAKWMEIESELLRFDVEGATRYWQQLGEAALQMQGEIMECFAHLGGPDGKGPAAASLNMMPVLAIGFGRFFQGNARSKAS